MRGMILAAVFLVSVFLVGCGEEQAEQDGETTVVEKTVIEMVEKTVEKTVEATTQATAVDCADPSLSQAEWTEHCQDAPPQTIETGDNDEITLEEFRRIDTSTSYG